MSIIHIQYSAIINATPEKVYAVISDYRVGHPAILPKPYFTGLTVVEGGQGAGTVVITEMNVFGVKKTYRQYVTEPEPGRVLVEDDPVEGIKTTFILEPLEGGKQTRITLLTESRASAGFRGFMERLMNPSITRRIYKIEMANLAAYLKAS